MSRKIYVLVGLPGVGKSTYRNEFLSHLKVVSSDDIIENVAREKGITYDMVFADSAYRKACFDMFDCDLRNALASDESFVLDQTNVSRKSRRKIFDRLNVLGVQPEIVAINFASPEPSLHRQILDLRAETGKTIPDNVIQSMIDNYEFPTLDEGFSRVIHVEMFV